MDVQQQLLANIARGARTEDEVSARVDPNLAVRALEQMVSGGSLRMEIDPSAVGSRRRIYRRT